jgi:hypothetical protein
MFARLFALTSVLVAAGSIPALAAQSQSQAPQASAAGYDPNERICETIPVIGSRLGKKKVCATRAEWAEKNRLDREAVDQAQKQVGGPCTTVGNRNTGGISC